eukprot:TRINITY_DN5865_c0_g1_i3.p2 TRINITY_DN5865_c0_g1~~TRINITY_DN5865_c0_g1_i3.p2  ORF type:complete len:316 (+),score=118.31 TRINITY_DN5865_c0_g1_i3:38-949(+)
MLRNRNKQHARPENQPLLDSEDRYSDDEGDTLLGGHRSGEKKNNIVAKAGRLFMDLIYAITDMIPGLDLVGDLPERDRARMMAFKTYVSQPYNAEDSGHFAVLRQLWDACCSEARVKEELGQPDVSSATWKKFGFQGTDPGTDFRGGGVFSLKNLVQFIEGEHVLFHRLMSQPPSVHSIPFAIAGINITMMLLHLLQFTTAKTCFSTAPTHGSITKLARKHMLQYMLNSISEGGDDSDEAVSAACEAVFMTVYCASYKILFALWEEEETPNIMQFNSVLLKTKTAIEEKLRRAATLNEFLASV